MACLSVHSVEISTFSGWPYLPILLIVDIFLKVVSYEVMLLPSALLYTASKLNSRKYSCFKELKNSDLVTA